MNDPIDYIIVIVVAAFIALCGYSWLESKQYEEELGQFIRNCESKGGIVLDGWKNQYNGWHGCYKGFTEIDAEVKK